MFQAHLPIPSLPVVLIYTQCNHHKNICSLTESFPSIISVLQGIAPETSVTQSNSLSTQVSVSYMPENTLTRSWPQYLYKLKIHANHSIVLSLS